MQSAAGSFTEIVIMMIIIIPIVIAIAIAIGVSVRRKNKRDTMNIDIFADNSPYSNYYHLVGYLSASSY